MKSVNEIIRRFAYSAYRRVFARFYRMMDELNSVITNQSTLISQLAAERDVLCAEGEPQRAGMAGHPGVLRSTQDALQSVHPLE